MKYIVLKNFIADDINGVTRQFNKMEQFEEIILLPKRIKMATELKLITPVSQKSLFEQALELVDLKVGDEFYFDMSSKGFNSTKFKVSKDGFVSLSNTSHMYFNVDLESLLRNPNCITKIKKTEAELILEELKTVVDKANKILGSK